MVLCKFMTPLCACSVHSSYDQCSYNVPTLLATVTTSLSETGVVVPISSYCCNYVDCKQLLHMMNTVQQCWVITSSDTEQMVSLCAPLEQPCCSSVKGWLGARVATSTALHTSVWPVKMSQDATERPSAILSYAMFAPWLLRHMASRFPFPSAISTRKLQQFHTWIYTALEHQV